MIRRAVWFTYGYTRLLPAAAAASIAGCMMGPNYQKPAVSVPAQWLERAGDEQATPVASSAWWMVYGDAELDDLIRRALRANLDLRNADDRIREARAMVRGGRAALRPRLDTSASAARGQESANAPGISPFLQGGDTGSGASPQNVFEAGFDASWELDLFGGARRSIEAVQADVQGVQFDRDAVALSLTSEVARTYVDLRNSQVQLQLATQSAAIQHEALAMVRSRYTGGLATDVDLAAAEAQYHGAEAAVPEWLTLCKLDIHRLGVLLGEAPESLSGKLAANRPLSGTLPAIATGLPSDLLRRRPDIRRAERQMSAASARIGVATSRLYPQFSLGASAGLASFTASNFFDPHSGIWAIGPSLTWPIFHGGRIRATIEVRNIQAQQALLIYRKTILTALEDVENALAAYHGERQRHDALGAVLASSRQALEHTRALYHGGIADLRSVLDQQRRVLQAQSDLARSTAAEWTGQIALYKALGGGWSAPDRQGDGAATPMRGRE